MVRVGIGPTMEAHRNTLHLVGHFREQLLGDTAS